MATSRGLLPSPQRLVADLVRAIGAVAVAVDDGDGDGDGDDDDRDRRPDDDEPAREPPPSSAVSANPLARLPASQRPLLAALHVLFPAVLLPAFDLLDRRRVVRFSSVTATAAASSSSSSPLYHVLGDTPHVVRLRAWHCTCAYFALRAAAGADPVEVEVEVEVADNDDTDNIDTPDTNNIDTPDTNIDTPDDTLFSIPPCRHLLACLLAEQWPALRTGVIAVDGCGPEVLAAVAAGLD